LAIFVYEEMKNDVIKLILHDKFNKTSWVLPKFLIDLTDIKKHKPCKICQEEKDIMNKIRRKKV